MPWSLLPRPAVLAMPHSILSQPLPFFASTARAQLGVSTLSWVGVLATSARRATGCDWPLFCCHMHVLRWTNWRDTGCCWLFFHCSLSCHWLPGRASQSVLTYATDDRRSHISCFPCRFSSIALDSVDARGTDRLCNAAVPCCSMFFVSLGNRHKDCRSWRVSTDRPVTLKP